MKKVCLFITFFLWLFLAVGSRAGLGQSDIPRWEVGAQLSILKLNYTLKGTESRPVNADDFWLGFGGRVTFNFNDNFALEGTVEKYNSGKTDQTLNTSGTFNTPARPDVQGLFGIKAGARREKFGIFAKVRPGFTRYSPVPTCTSISSSSCTFNQETSFSLDAGGVVEGYISRRLIYRGDFGVVYMRHRETTLFFPGEPGIPPFQFTGQGFKTYSPKFSIGVGFRF